jgi:hypothetical protein
MISNDIYTVDTSFDGVRERAREGKGRETEVKNEFVLLRHEV